MEPVTYFNGHNAEISIKTLAVKTVLPDSITLEYSESFQKMPIYGYKSVLADEFLLGEKLIQGQFSISTADEFSLDALIRAGQDDTTYTPLLSADPLIAQNTFDIIIKYGKMEFNKENKKYELVEASLQRTIKDVTVTGMQTGFSSDATPASEFYNFVAKRVI